VIAARLDDYRDVAPRGSLDLLFRLAERLRGRRFLHLNASRFGAGSPEILARMTPMLRDLGIETSWEVVVGHPEFYAAARDVELGLSGVGREVSPTVLRHLVDAATANAAALQLEADVAMVHDVPALTLVRHRPGTGRWVWCCHQDVSQAYRRVWHAVRPDVERYDAAVFALPRFAQRLPIPTLIVHPSLDPLSERNRELSRTEVRDALERLGVPRDKPILLQVAPYTRNADPLGVIRAFRLVRKHTDCRLVLAGWGAADNPEGSLLLAEVREAAGRDPDLHVLTVPPDAALPINALQRAATLVVHKPLQEDFGLAVSEAMWKGKPVVGTVAGGLPAQVIPDVTGFAVHSVEGAALRIRQLLGDPDLAARMGGASREYARRAFLITRHLGDYLALLASLTE
jgi:trehalose synthase